MFAFNNMTQQQAIAAEGGVRFSCFLDFLQSDDEYFRCNAAFQVFVIKYIQLYFRLRRTNKLEKLHINAKKLMYCTAFTDYFLYLLHYVLCCPINTIVTS